MFRYSSLPALLLLAAACGDDKKTSQDPADASADAATADAAIEVIPARVTSTGAKCTGASDCEGEEPQCLKDVAFPGGAFFINFEGGYCSSPCTVDSECVDSAGEGAGACPLGALTRLPLPATLQDQLLPASTCLATCDSDDDCRSPAYHCRTSAAALRLFLPPDMAAFGELAAGVLPDDTYCIPDDVEVAALDAGTSADAATTGDASGITDGDVSDDDAGAADASEPSDAGVGDAASSVDAV